MTVAPTVLRDRLRGHEADLLALLAELVSMESPSDDRGLASRVAERLAAEATSIGLQVELEPAGPYAQTVVARMAGSNPPIGRRVLLVGHYDTVYPAGTLGQHPFRIDGDVAYGPGVFDMKGGLVIGLHALRALRVLARDRCPPVTFVMNGDEEPGSPNSRATIEREARDHDLAIVLEPGRPGPALTMARKGVGIFRMAVAGIEAHAGAEPEKGANSLVELAHKIIAIERLSDRAAGTTVTVGVARGGTQPYVVPGSAELSLDVRVETDAERDRILESLHSIAATTHVPGTTTGLDGSFHRPPLQASPSAEAYAAIAQRIAAEIGYPLGLGASGGASDGNLTSAMGTPTIDGFGAHGGGAHSPREYAEVSSLTRKAAVLAAFLLVLGELDGPVDA
jgi:glutamate carboxypeptidase